MNSYEKSFQAQLLMNTPTKKISSPVRHNVPANMEHLVYSHVIHTSRIERKNRIRYVRDSPTFCVMIMAKGFFSSYLSGPYACKRLYDIIFSNALNNKIVNDKTSCIPAL